MDITKLIRKNILNLKPYTSARDLYNNPNFVLLDANENNFGSTFDEIPGLELNRYPDPRQNEMRELIADTFGLKKEQLFFGVGSDEIIDLLIRIFCEPGKDSVIIPEPTFGMYEVFCDINDIETRSICLNDEFQLDIKAIKKSFDKNTKIIFLCSPNNPTGNLLKREDVLSLCKSINSLVIVDEAYIEFTGDLSLAEEVKNYTNLVVLRTFSKAWGLAGIRLGYSVSDPEITDYLFKVKSPCNINTLTRYAIKKAFQNSEIKNEYVAVTIKERAELINQLESLSGILKVYPSDANFLLVKVENAKKLQQSLAEKGIIVRDRSSQLMLENCVRISIGTKEENIQLLQAIKEIV